MATARVIDDKLSSVILYQTQNTHTLACIVISAATCLPSFQEPLLHFILRAVKKEHSTRHANVCLKLVGLILGSTKLEYRCVK